MRCPCCHGQLVPGRIDISRTTLGAITDFVTGDLACMPHYVYFYPEGGGEALCLDHSRRAFHCPSCEALVIAGTGTRAESASGSKQLLPESEARGNSDEAVGCLSCGHTIPAGAGKCPSCGWSWDASSQ
jgi:hypothetical protein